MTRTSDDIAQLSRRGFGKALIGTLATGAALGPAGRLLAGTTYPTRPVTVVLAFGTGGTADIVNRLIAPEIEKEVGQRIVIQNVPGAGGLNAMQTVAHAGNDGYTLLNNGAAAAIKQTLMPHMPYHGIADFDPVTPVSNFGLALLVKPGSKFTSVEKLLTYAKANPGALNIGTVSVGSTQYLSAKLFTSTAGIDAMVIPYVKTPELLGAVARGDVDIAFEMIPPALSAITNKQVVPIATTMAKRSALFPDLPTVEEGGVKPYDVSSWNGYSAPKGVPEIVKKVMNPAVQKVVQMPHIKSKLAALGIEPYIGTPADMAARQQREAKLWHKVIIEAGVPIEG